MLYRCSFAVSPALPRTYDASCVPTMCDVDSVIQAATRAVPQAGPRLIASVGRVSSCHAIFLARSSAASVLQDRVAKLQELYMRDLDQSRAMTVHEGIQQSNLLQLATPEMLALSQPPADFRLEEDARSTRIVPALHEIDGLRRERKTLKDQVNDTQTTAATFLECTSAAKSADSGCCGLSSLHHYSTFHPRPPP